MESQRNVFTVVEYHQKVNRLQFQNGQTLIEYLVLLSVVALIVLTVTRNSVFQRLLGPNSNMFSAISRYMEFTYRHGLSGTYDSSNYGPGSEHETYYKNGSTRFFSGLDEYKGQ